MKTTILASLVALTLAPMSMGQGCVGDVVADNRVDGGDLGTLLANWGPVTSSSVSRACDLDGDNLVTGADLGMVLASWGACPPPQPQVPAWATLLEGLPSPDVVTDPALRASIASTGLAWRIKDTATQIEMLLVPPGTFQMGCLMDSAQTACGSADAVWELPAHTVSLTAPIYLGRYEVTQAQWQARMGSNPSYFQGGSNSASRPVEQVSWNAIQPFLVATGMRLPTEAEWEFACRAGAPTPFHSGPGFSQGTIDDNLATQIAWIANPGCDGECSTKPVGQKSPNSLGFHDMLGNVEEWVNDWFANYTSASLTNPLGPLSGQDRAFRGGSFGNISRYARTSARGRVFPAYTSYSIGFRVARNP